MGGTRTSDAARPAGGPDGRATCLLRQLRSDGRRTTVARKALVEADDHRGTADDLVAVVHRSAPAVHRSTVYRTLDSLEHAGGGRTRPRWPRLRPLPPHRRPPPRSGGRRVRRLVQVPESVVAPRRDECSVGYGSVVDVRRFALPGGCRFCAALTPGG